MFIKLIEQILLKNYISNQVLKNEKHLLIFVRPHIMCTSGLLLNARSKKNGEGEQNDYICSALMTYTCNQRRGDFYRATIAVTLGQFFRFLSMLLRKRATKKKE